MVPSDQGYSIWVPHLCASINNGRSIIKVMWVHVHHHSTDLESQQEEKCFYAIKPSVHKVAQEEVVCFWDIPSHLEEFL